MSKLYFLFSSFSCGIEASHYTVPDTIISAYAEEGWREVRVLHFFWIIVVRYRINCKVCIQVCGYCIQLIWLIIVNNCTCIDITSKGISFCGDYDSTIGETSTCDLIFIYAIFLSICTYITDSSCIIKCAFLICVWIYTVVYDKALISTLI